MKDSRWAGCTVTNDTLPAIVEPSPCFAFKEEIVKTVHCFSGSTKNKKKTTHTHTKARLSDGSECTHLFGITPPKLFVIPEPRSLQDK